MQVSVVGTQIGAQTNDDGQYRLNNVPPGPRTVRVQRLYDGVRAEVCKPGHVIADPDTGLFVMRTEHRPVLLTTVTRVDPMWVNFGVPDNEQLRLQREMKEGRVVAPKGGRFEVELRLADGSAYPHAGRVDFTSVNISPGTGTGEVRAEVPNPDGWLRPGQFVRVLLRGATRPGAITVPQRAVLEGPQGKFVYLVNEKNLVEARPVVAGAWSGDAWIITSGLEGGERVITDGVMKLGPGAPVKIATKK
mgnify:CR=1 FL=1